MKGKDFLMGLLLGIILILVMGATYKFYLSDYTEECYEYDKIPATSNFTWQDWNDYSCCLGWGGMFCSCKIINKTITYNTTIDGACRKYHLVRYA
jgi:hypothetical protein